MCKGMIGKKLGMTGLYGPTGDYFPVTVIQVGPCKVVQVKTVATDGYNALQLGFGQKRASRVNKPLKGHFEKSGGVFSVLKEFPVDNPEDFQVGQTIATEIFSVGERVDISGKIKGRGFSGVMKRHGFHGGRKTHGSHSHRIPGSIGCSAWPARVIKGKKMPGQYGNAKQTVSNLEILDIRPNENLMLVKGIVPGFKTGILEVKKLKYPKLK